MNCRKCGNEIQDDANFCTYCGNAVEKPTSVSPNIKIIDFFKWNSDNPLFKNKPVAIVVIVFIILGIIGNLIPEEKSSSAPKEDKSLLTVEKYGESYPYTIDNLKLHCKDHAVWVEDSALNKWALNGLAYGKFQGRGDFKGYSSEISKNDPNIKGAKVSDSNIQSLGFELCE